jgi:hypothetical protein
MGGAIGGLVNQFIGPVLDSIGLGALKPLVSAAFNFATGNYMGLIGDLGQMINQFSGGAMNNVAQQPPIADAFGGNQQGQNVGQNQAANQGQGTAQTEGNRPQFMGPPANRMNELLQLLRRFLGGQGQQGQGTQGQNGGIGDLFQTLSKLFRLMAQMGQGQDQITTGRERAQFGQFA